MAGGLHPEQRVKAAVQGARCVRVPRVSAVTMATAEQQTATFTPSELKPTFSRGDMNKTKTCGEKPFLETVTRARARACRAVPLFSEKGGAEVSEVNLEGLLAATSRTGASP